jgi:hypothetical protein
MEEQVANSQQDVELS